MHLFGLDAYLDPDTDSSEHFCTCCGESHTLSWDQTPLTAEDFPNCRIDVAEYPNTTDLPEAICEDCYDAVLQHGDPNFPEHDLL